MSAAFAQAELDMAAGAQRMAAELIDHSARMYLRNPCLLANIRGIDETSSPEQILSCCDDHLRSGPLPRMVGFSGSIPLANLGGAKRYALWRLGQVALDDEPASRECADA